MQNPGRNKFWLIVAVATCASLAAFDSLAQSYPIKPIRMVVGFPAGSGTDSMARIAAQKLSEQLGQTVVVDNRGGAAGSIATEAAAKSPADGYTLLILAAADAVQPALRAKLPYDLERDFAPVSLMVTGAFPLIIHPSVPVRNVKELLALARSKPGKLSYGSSGIGSSAHFGGELFKLMAKVNILHVPYKGSAESSVATAAGEVDISFSSIPAALPLMKAGKVKALAVTSSKRSSAMPDIPTLDEAGVPGYDRSIWYGIVVPAGTPKDVIAQLNAAVGKSINTPEMKETLFKQGLDPQANTPEQFTAFIRSEIAQNAKLVKAMGLKVE